MARLKKIHIPHHFQHQTERWARAAEEESKPVPASGRPIEFDDTSISHSILSKLDQDAVSVQDAVDAHEGSPSHEAAIEMATPWQRLLRIAEWDFEMKRIAALSVPYAIQGLAEGIFDIINLAVVGNFIGVKEANAFVMVSILLEFTECLTYGFAEGNDSNLMMVAIQLSPVDLTFICFFGVFSCWRPWTSS